MFSFGRKKLGLALTCSDWRLHQSAVEYNRRIARALGVGGLDLIAVPGPDGLLVPARASEWQTALRQAMVLIGAHHPVAIGLVAHQRCAGHAVSDEEHETDVLAVAAALKEATKFEGPLSAMLTVYHSDKRWSLKQIGVI